MPTNEEKQAVWQAYYNRKPTRVPVTYGINPRIVLFNRNLNPFGITFEDYFKSASALIEIQIRFAEYVGECINQYRDSPVERPKHINFYVDNQNSYDSLYFGTPLEFRDGQVADTLPILAGADKYKLFDMDIEHPLNNPFIKDCLKRYEDIKQAIPRLSYKDMTFSVSPPLLGFDGHLTIATCLRGSELYSDIYEDPEYFHRLLSFIHNAVIIRNRALAEFFGHKAFNGKRGGFADDSIQLISLKTYKEMVMPYHKQWYSLWSEEGPHSMHLCGDATRHFPTIVKELHVDSFDTGFPVDFAWLRKAIGNDIEILGGPEVSILLNGTPEQVYNRTKEILQSGIMEGGRFILRDANNLPPNVPEENLSAMYNCCLEYGNYSNMYS
ncbi:MAG: uroporphyrinogen decarboxylase family protein [Candidatus Poribacteria bacterium]